MSAKREDWCTAEEAAAMVDRSVYTIYRWVRDGEVKAIKPRRTRLLLIADVLKTEAKYAA